MLSASLVIDCLPQSLAMLTLGTMYTDLSKDCLDLVQLCPDILHPRLIKFLFRGAGQGSGVYMTVYLTPTRKIVVVGSNPTSHSILEKGLLLCILSV